VHSPVVAAVIVLAGCGGDNSPTAASPAVSPTVEPAAARPGKTVTNSIGMRFVKIPSGEFLMGSVADDPGALEDEQPQHKVRITRPFLLGMYEVTQGEFEAVLHANPSSFQKSGLLQDPAETIDQSRLPVDNVTWNRAVEFCRELSETAAEKEAGRVYRLPTEAEWEYACRAGTTTPFHYGDALSSTQANFNGAYPFGKADKGPFLNRTQIIGSYAPNAFGLYDMHGNLFEWCADRFDRDYYRRSPENDPRGPESGSYRVIRGGDWYSDARDCRSAFRYADVPEGRFYALGFRVVCDLSGQSAAVLVDVAEDDGGKTSPPELTAATTSAGKPLPTSGEDWPRWRGPRGDGTWNAPDLATTWPASGLTPSWSRELGGGYGGVAVSAGRVYVMDRQREPEDYERVHCFDAVTGEPLWSHQYKVNYQGVSYDNGPRATPTVHRDRVYTLGAVGHLYCFDTARGEIHWSKDLVGKFGARVPIWGLSASPVVFEDLLIVHAGIENDGCYVAFDLTTGDERWRSLPDPAGYATPIVIDRSGTAELVGWTPNNVRGLNPQTGEMRWTIPFEVNFGTAIADPIFQEGLVLVSSYYEGTKAIRFGTGPQDAEVAWEDRRNLRGLMSQPLYREGHVYLLDKLHGLTCFELATGKKLWDDNNRMTPKGRNPQATLVWLNDADRAIVLNSDGDLILCRLNPQGPVEEARSNIIDRTWAHPGYAGNCVYARSDSKLVCVVLP
jgi:formylglycine-generating enzyme required for sulfatase activity